MYPEVFETQPSPSGTSILVDVLQNVTVSTDKSSTLGMSTILVLEAATKVADANADRISVWLSNKGTTPIFIAGNSAITKGNTGYNFLELTAGQDIELKHYTGELWAYSGVSTQYLGRADIG